MPSGKPQSKPAKTRRPVAVSRSENMRRIKSRDTGPEIAVRRLLYSLGYRYRLNHKTLPGKPDIVFAKRRKVIFVHGCFWHAHGCRMSHNPRTNTAYWSPKLARNVERDSKNQTALEQLGWQTLTLWECDIQNHSPALTLAIVEFLSG
jgi:DNA mismatch endonuclease (patch repair protein)